MPEHCLVAGDGTIITARHIKRRDLQEFSDGRVAGLQESEPPYERGSGVTPVEQREAGWWKRKERNDARTTSVSVPIYRD
jgi:hypothetical protein